MVNIKNTKFVYRDIATGRLLHKRQAESRPDNTWIRELFVPPSDHELPFSNTVTSNEPMLVMDDDEDCWKAASQRDRDRSWAAA